MVKLEYSVEKPLNREPEMEALVNNFITIDCYDRNHGPIPHLDPLAHRVGVFGLVKQAISLSVAELLSFPQHTVICALQCAGNRRHTMRTKLKEVSGIDWFDGAVMNCKWTGPLLCHVLTSAGVSLGPDQWQDAHVAFACFQTPTQDDEYYGASIPLDRAMDPQSSILLALSMNGEPLPAKHGAPVRVITPGIAGARSVKWLDRITVQRAESESFYQQRDYKILPPEADCKEKASKYWGLVSSLQDMPVNSVIGVPKSHSTIHRADDGTIEVKGYALPSGSSGPVVKVELSTDGGETWIDAELTPAYEHAETEDVELKWAWTLWTARVQVAVGNNVQIFSRATDKSGSRQNQSTEWNFRGVAYNGYGEASGLKIV